MRRIKPAYRHDLRSLYTCKDCAHSYDFHSPNNYNGEPTLCRCPFYTEGKFSKVTSSPQCDKFNSRA